MFQKILVLTIGLLLLSAQCFAMTFFQPVDIGSAFIDTTGCFSVEGATYHTGIPFTNEKFIKAYNLRNRSETIYDKGTARFGNGEDAIYFHYDSKNGNSSYDYNPVISKFGDKNIENTVSVNTGHPGNIRMIKSDGGVTLYLISCQSQISRFSGYQWIHTLIGKRQDGRFVIFFEPKEFCKRYFKNSSGWYVNFADCTVQGDTIVFKFKHSADRTNTSIKPTSGEFRFKWDDKAQWFGVEQVVY